MTSIWSTVQPHNVFIEREVYLNVCGDHSKADQRPNIELCASLITTSNNDPYRYPPSYMQYPIKISALRFFRALYLVRNLIRIRGSSKALPHLTYPLILMTTDYRQISAPKWKVTSAPTNSLNLTFPWSGNKISLPPCTASNQLSDTFLN